MQGGGCEHPASTTAVGWKMEVTPGAPEKHPTFCSGKWEGKSFHSCLVPGVLQEEETFVESHDENVAELSFQSEAASGLS